MIAARRLVLAVVVLAALAGSAAAQEARRAYLRRVPDRATFERYGRVVGSDRFGKFIIDVKSDEIYFIDVNLFKLHADFVLGVLLQQAWTADNIREYNKNYERVKPRFILGYLTEHLKVGKLTFSFWEGDQIDAAGVLRVKQRLDQSFFAAADLAFRPDSPAQERVAREVARRGLATITNDTIYQAADYQAFNKGVAVGRLRVVPRGQSYDALSFDRDEIALLQEAYPDISPVAGILSTRFSTPLAHVNLRATAWGIPNASFKQAFETYRALDGKTVYFEVTDTGHTLRAATAAEVASFSRRQIARKVVLPAADLTTPNLAMLTRIRAKQVTTYGTKTANLGEIVTANLAGVKVPAGFGVPFRYYAAHLERAGLNPRIATMLADPRFTRDAAFRRTELEALRQAIRAAPLDPALLDALYKRIRLKLGGKGVFVRSSTNAEDLPGFNGAGLYDTVPNVRGKQALADAMRQVWASVWNLRAVDERALFGIDHRQVFGAVLIQIGLDASAAGVLVTDNLWNPEDDSSYTINAKWGLGIRVVEGTKVPEQIVFDTSNDGTRIISRSDDPVMLVFDDHGGIREVPTPAGGVILTEERAKRLAQQVQAIVPLFPRDAPLDVEWVMAGEEMWIVQARPFVGAR